MTDSLSPVALSRLTWTADDRRAWQDTYRAALWVSVRRDERAREERRAAQVAAYWQNPVSLRYRDARAAVGDPRYSVHVDVLAGREG